MRLFPVDDPAHLEAEELLPWLVNETLDSVERPRVERHLAECIACKRESVNLRTLQEVVMDDDSDPSVAPALSRVRARIEELESVPRAAWLVRAVASQWRATHPWLRGAVIAQFVLLALLAHALVNPSSPQYYHTLSAPATAGGSRAGLVVVFDAALPEREMRDLLLRLRARIVDGPSPRGAYTLEIDAGERQAVLAELRRTHSVTFAEPARQPLRSQR
jgi:hypothetical protein